MAFSIDIVNRTRTSVPASWCIRPARAARRVLGRRVSVRRLGISLVGTTRMRTLNRYWRGLDRPTDILSFSGSGTFVWPEAIGPEADLVIALPVARAEARMRRIHLREALARLVIHGMAHLAGFDHEGSGRQARRMAAIEARIHATIT